MASQAGLIFDAAGNLYGTTYTGGTYNDGTVFELSPSAGGGWSETVLHSFDPDGSDGLFPQSGLIFDAAGNLYGTTIGGGTYDYGTVFELSPTPGGGWTERVLYSFGNGTDGAYPFYAAIFDAGGNLYGTTFRVALTTAKVTAAAGRFSSCRPRSGEPGRRRCCITSATGRTGILPGPV